MNKLHEFEPFWNSWYIDSLIGEGSFGSVYKIVREEFGQKYYAALKVISIPRTENEIKQVYFEGMDEDSASDYFREVVKDIYEEIALMSQLKGKTNIVNYEDHLIIERKDTVGYHIFIRMELLQSLNEFAINRNLSNEEIVRMGKDICKALILCEKNDIVHRDIKLDNIFVSSDGDYKLGDFGIAKQIHSAELGLSIKGSYEFMAPEVYLGKDYDHRVDIYSLGIVLYSFLNGRKIPFLPADSSTIRHSQRQEALLRRFKGEDMPMPAFASDTLGKVILKAIAFNPKIRYETAEEFYEALNSLEALDLIIEGNTGTNKNYKKIEGMSYTETDEAELSSLMNRISLISEEDIGPTLSLSGSELEEDYEEDIKVVNLRNKLDISEEDPKRDILKEKRKDQGKSNKIKKQKRPKLKNKKKINKIQSDNQTGEKANKHIEKVNKHIDKKDMKHIDKEMGTQDIDSDLTKNEQNSFQIKRSYIIAFIGVIGAAAIFIFFNIFSSIHYINKEKKDGSFDKVSLNEPIKPYEINMSDKGLTNIVNSEDLNKVTILDISNNKIKDIEPLGNSLYLVSLKIQGNNISDIHPVGNMTELSYLDGSDNHIQEVEALSGLKKLTTLKLGNNEIYDIEILSKLVNMKTLHLNNNYIDDITPLSELEKLKYLDLSNNEIDDYTPLYELKELDVLILKNTSISKKELGALQKKLPDCTIKSK